MKRITLKNLPVHSEKPLLFTVIMLTMVLLSSGSAIIPDGKMQKEQSSSEKKLRLLEMLEKGEKLSSEQIRASFTYDQLCSEPFIPMPDEFNEMMIDLGKEMEELGRNIEDFHNSVEFKNEIERFAKEREKFKLDMEKVRQEIKKATKEIRESGIEIEMG